MTKQTLEQLYALDLLVFADKCDLPHQGTFIEVIATNGIDVSGRLFALVSHDDLKNDKSFKQFQAAHQAMLAAYRIKDYTCAAQDLKEAHDFADNLGFEVLSPFYDIIKVDIMLGLTGKAE